MHYDAQRKRIRSALAGTGTHRRCPERRSGWAGLFALITACKPHKIKSCQTPTARGQTSPEGNKMLLPSCATFSITFVTARVGFSVCRNTNERLQICVRGQDVFKNVPNCLPGLNVIHVDRRVNKNKPAPNDGIFWPLLTWFYQPLKVELKLFHVSRNERSVQKPEEVTDWKP